MKQKPKQEHPAVTSFALFVQKNLISAVRGKDNRKAMLLKSLLQTVQSGNGYLD